MNYQPVEFPSEGALLRGRLYSQSGQNLPAVVMAHGTSATVTMVIDAYAEAFYEAGFTVLLYDHHSIGRSGGEPRQHINPWIQGRGYRDAVAYLRGLPNIGEIALWGDSYSGMIVLVVGALIDDVAAVVAQMPGCGATLPSLTPDEGAFEKLKTIFMTEIVTNRSAQVAGPMPVVSSDQAGTPSLLTPIQAFRWFIEHGGRFGSHWENRITRVVPDTEVPFHPILTAAHLTMPVQFLIGHEDEMIQCNPEVQRAVFDRIAGPKEFVEIDGGHFGPMWKPSAAFDENCRRQIDFLSHVLQQESGAEAL